MDKQFNEHMIASPVIPFFYYDERLSKSPCKVYIAGFLPSHSTDYASINLVNGLKFPRINIPFHLSIRPNERQLVRNSWKHSSGWQREERQLRCGYPLFEGDNFDIMISIKLDRISVAINGQHSFDFVHRLKSTTINMLEIHGDVRISSIRFEYF